MDSAAEDTAMADLRNAFGQNLSFGGHGTIRLEQEAAKLNFTLKIESFPHLAHVIKYGGFLKEIETCNSQLTPEMRRIVELAWFKLVEQESAKWTSIWVTNETKKFQIGCALDQIKSEDAENFWTWKSARQWGNETVSYGIDTAAQITSKDTIVDVNMIALAPSDNRNAIKIPRVKKGFIDLSHKLKYKGFLVQIENMNGRRISRGVAEAEWKKLVHELISEWTPVVGSQSKHQNKEDELLYALEQVNGYEYFDPKTYWDGNSPDALRIPDSQAEVERKTKKKTARAQRKAIAKEAREKEKEKAVKTGRIKKKGQDAPRRSRRVQDRRLIDALDSMFSQLGV